MAQHGDVARPPPALSPSPLAGGGAPAPARVHRPALVTGAAAPAEVSLESPRPDGERAANEYVETPFRAGAGRDAPKGQGGAAPKGPGAAARAPPPHHHALVLPVGPLHPPHPPAKPDARTPPPGVRFATHKRPAALPGAPVVSKQPAAAAAATFTKDAGARAGSSAASPAPAADCSIICAECGRCRCQSCRQPRPLPQCWLCNNMCLVSAETVVDYASCLCCVKGLYYHCVVDYEADAALADDPCACGPPRKLSRWGCLGLLSLVLPCLWCYWPARGCVRVAERAYARYAGHGCRCAPRPHAFAADAATPQKRLLDAALDF